VFDGVLQCYERLIIDRVRRCVVGLPHANNMQTKYRRDYLRCAIRYTWAYDSKNMLHPCDRSDVLQPGIDGTIIVILTCYRHQRVDCCRQCSASPDQDVAREAVGYIVAAMTAITHFGPPWGM
jgi:hypothetical protein